MIPNGIDIQVVRNATPKKRSELVISESAFVVGMIGRISAQKAPDIFVKAAKLIKTQIPNSSFIIVGDGELRPEIEKFASENDLQLYITGWTDEPYSYLKVFDVSVLPSRWEGFGIIPYYSYKNLQFIGQTISSLSARCFFYFWIKRNYCTFALLLISTNGRTQGNSH